MIIIYLFDFFDVKKSPKPCTLVHGETQGLFDNVVTTLIY